MRSLWAALLWQWHHWDVAASHLLGLPAPSPWRRGLATVGAHLGDSWFWLLMSGLLWRWWRTTPNPQARPLWGWGVSLLSGAAVTLFAKQWARRPRPKEARLLYGGGADRYSFPSGHAVRWGIVAAWGGRFVPHGGLLAWPLALWTGWSRVYLGVHYTGDVVAGFALGTTIGWLMRVLLGETARRSRAR